MTTSRGGILACSTVSRYPLDHISRPGLMVNDSVMASTTLSAGLEVITTSDADSRRVRLLRVAEPGDLGQTT